MAACDYGCSPLLDYVEAICGDYENGGQPAVAIIECDAALVDYTDPGEWTAAIAAGTVKLITGVRAQMPEAAPVEVANPVGGSSENFTINYDRQLSWVDNNVSSTNQAFYDDLNNRRTYIAIFNPDSDTIRVHDQSPVDYQAKDMMPESSGELTSFNVVAKWRYKGMPTIYAAPAGIFE